MKAESFTVHNCLIWFVFTAAVRKGKTFFHRMTAGKQFRSAGGTMSLPYTFPNVIYFSFGADAFSTFSSCSIRAV